MNVLEIKAIAEELQIPAKEVLKLARTSEGLLDLLKAIRNSAGNSKSIRILFINDRIKSGVKFSVKPIEKGYFVPIESDKIEIVTDMFMKDFSETFGTTSQFRCGSQYPISILKDGEYKLGVKSKNPQMVKSLNQNLIRNSR